MPAGKRIASAAAVLAVTTSVSWALVTVPAPPPASARAVISAPAVGSYPGPQRGQLLIAAALTAERQHAEAVAAAQARHAAVLRVREHVAHVAHLAHERHLAQLAADAAAASAAPQQAPQQQDVVSSAPQQQAAVTPPPPSAGQYSFSGLEQLWVAAGGPAWAEASAATVAECESGGNPRAYNPSGASGLWQILGQVSVGWIFDPMVNAENAVAKFRASGDTFAQWVCQP